MNHLSRFLLAALTLSLMPATSAFAAEEIGKALAVTVTVSGDGGELAKASPIHRDERIRTSSSGTGQFEFRDGTKLAVGPNSSLVLDRSIFSGESSFQTLTLKATRGTFRWVSGSSKSSAYKINTPFGTLGVRGTVFDFYVNSRTAAVVLLEGQATFCGNDGVCKRLDRGCDFVRADRRGVTDDSRKVAKTAVNGVKNEEAFPFLVGTRKLNRPFQVGGGRCGLSRSATLGIKKDGGGENKPERERPARGTRGDGGGDSPNGPF